jgi:hypothetical protein
MAEGFGQSWAEDGMYQEVASVLAKAPSYRQLDARTQRALAESLIAVTRALTAGTPTDIALASVSDLRSRMGDASGDSGSGDSSSGGGSGAAPAPADQQPASTPASSPAPAATGAGGHGSTSPTSRMGDVARATLNAIDFPAFVAGLISGTFHAIVDASIQQMEAYAVLLKNVAMSVDKFMGDNISEQSARDHLADQYDSVFARYTAGGVPKLVVKKNGSGPSEMPSFLSDLGFKSTDDIDDDAVNNVVVPAARRDMAQSRQQTLATMVMMGINRVLVDDGEINAKLQFHIDASETTKIKFDQKKTTNGTISGQAGRNPFSANAIMVNTVNLNAQSDLNVRADLTGEVKVKFRSEAFPLERFADSAAIQLINQNAKVPAPAPAAASTTPAQAASPATPAPAAPPAAAPTPAPATPPSPAAGGTAPAAQSLAAVDPWFRR